MLEGIRFAVLTISDRSSRGEREDLSGPALCNILREKGSAVVETGIVPDERARYSGRHHDAL